MDQPLIADAPTVRRHIARTVADDHDSPRRLGSITLRPHQRSAVTRLRRVIAESGGALLADAVGLGKTFVAIALARDAVRPLVVAPATLVHMWSDALARTDVRCDITSYERLSRGTTSPATGSFDLVVLDEAHHARTPSTIRYQRLATLTANARVLLLSATPIHNSRRDLAALLALFLGRRAWQLSDNDLARYVVRREAGDAADARLPRLEPPVWLPIDDDRALLDEIVELPPPLPPSDGGDEGALLAWSLARQWSSSIGALTSSLRRRLARGIALDAALAEGRHPTRESLTLWACDDAAAQLAFPQLLPASAYPTSELRARLATHLEALQTLLRHAREHQHVDTTRAQRLRDIRATHPNEKIVAFSQYTHTVHTLASHLRTERAVATLTSHGGTVAGGPITRHELLARFAPAAHHAPPPREIERIDLLVTTDLLSEGVNLHDASVIVHLDLPWTPARLEQRVGRSRRLGATHSHTTVYALAPPAPAEALLRVEARLREKLAHAGRTVGIAGAILPAWTHLDTADSPTRHLEHIAHRLAAWHHHTGTRDRDGPAQPPVRPRPLAAAVRTDRQCVLAVLHDGTHVELAASLDGEPMSRDPRRVLAAIDLTGGDDAPLTPPRLDAALALIQRWITTLAARRASGAELPLHAPARRHAIRRIAVITAHAPYHSRPALAALAAHARRAVTVPYGIGAERVLGELACAPMADEAWLRALATFADLNANTACPTTDADFALIALLVGVPPGASH